MNKITIGMLLVFLNFNLDINATRIGLIPSFLGYLIMLIGLGEIGRFSGRFSKIRPLVTVMFAYSTVLYFMDIYGLWAVDMRFLIIALSLIFVIMSLYVAHSIVMGIKDIEALWGVELDSDKLYYAWQVLVLFNFIVYVVFHIPPIGTLFVIIGFIVGVYYLAAFDRTAKLFYANYPAIESSFNNDGRNGRRKLMLFAVIAIVTVIAGFYYIRGYNLTEQRFISPSGEFRLSYNARERTLTMRGANRRWTESDIYDPHFIWSPCGQLVAQNITGPHWNRQARVIDFNDDVTIIAPCKNFMQIYFEEMRTEIICNREHVEIIEWIDSEHLLMEFSWPSNIPGQDLSGWFIWHLGTWTITELVIT